MILLAHGTVDTDTGDALLAGVATRLSPQECTLLRYLAERAGQAVSRDELLVRVLGVASTVVSRAADTAMARLRRKIEPDPARPVHLVSVFNTGYRFEPLSAAPVVTERVGLPVERTPFVGRRDALERLGAAVEGHPLVALVGPGGAGKTRLASAFARTAARDRVVYVGLRSATTTSEAVGRVGEALGVPAEEARVADRAVAAVVRRLSSARTLLVLDNAEQLPADFAQVLGALVMVAGVLVTSRRPTGAPGEHVVRLGGLAPADATRLWRDRAQAAGAPGDPDDCAELGALLEELDHLPLAIELAAARARTLSPGQIRRRLSERMRLLSGGPRDGETRDTSLAATLDWSWELLTPAQREVLARCSVFVGPFADVAAAAVAGPDAPARLVELEAASLCVRGVKGTDFLRLVHVWARGKAVEAGVCDDAEVRHGRFFVGTLSDPGLPLTFDGVARVGAVLPELLAVPARLEVLDPDTAIRAALLPREWYQMHGPFEPWFAALDAAERAAGRSGDPRLHRILRARGQALRLNGEVRRALDEMDRALLVAPAEARGTALMDRSLTLGDLGRFSEAQEALLAALELLPDGPDRVHAEATYAGQRMMRGSFDDDLEERFRRCLDAVDRGVMSERVAAGIRANFGAWLIHVGRLDEAEEVLVAAAVTLRSAGADGRLAGVLMNLGGVSYRRGRRAAGTTSAEEALELVRRGGYRRMLAWNLCCLASLRLADGDAADAVQILDEADEVARDVGDRSAQHAVSAWRAVTLARLGRIAEADQELERARTAHRATGSTADGLVRVAAAHVDLARVGDPDAAERVARVLAGPPVGLEAGFLMELLRARGATP